MTEETNKALQELCGAFEQLCTEIFATERHVLSEGTRDAAEVAYDKSKALRQQLNAEPITGKSEA